MDGAESFVPHKYCSQTEQKDLPPGNVTPKLNLKAPYNTVPSAGHRTSFLSSGGTDVPVCLRRGYFDFIDLNKKFVNTSKLLGQ